MAKSPLEPKLVTKLVKALRFAPDGRSVATIGGDWVRIWDVATAKETRRIVMPNAPRGGPGPTQAAARRNDERRPSRILARRQGPRGVEPAGRPDLPARHGLGPGAAPPRGPAGPSRPLPSRPTARSWRWASRRAKDRDATSPSGCGTWPRGRDLVPRAGTSFRDQRPGLLPRRPAPALGERGRHGPGLGCCRLDRKEHITSRRSSGRRSQEKMRHSSLFRRPMWPRVVWVVRMTGHSKDKTESSPGIPPGCQQRGLERRIMIRRRAFRPALWDVLEGRIALSSAAAAVGHQAGAADVQSAITAPTSPSYEELTTTYANGDAGNIVGVGNITGTTQTEYRLTVPTGSNTTTTTESITLPGNAGLEKVVDVSTNRATRPPRISRPPCPMARSRPRRRPRSRTAARPSSTHRLTRPEWAFKPRRVRSSRAARRRSPTRRSPPPPARSITTTGSSSTPVRSNRARRARPPGPMARSPTT